MFLNTYFKKSVSAENFRRRGVDVLPWLHYSELLVLLNKHSEPTERNFEQIASIKSILSKLGFSEKRLL